MSNKVVWTGRVLGWAMVIFLFTSGVNVAFVKQAAVMDGFTMFGYPANVINPIGYSALLASTLYLIPRTSVLGAILLTGYFGGAIATHVRINDPTFVVALVLGILTWFALWLQDSRLRALLPLR